MNPQIDPDKNFMMLALEHGYKSSSHMAVLQFNLAQLTKKFYFSDFEVLPGYTLKKMLHVTPFSMTKVRIQRNKRYPTKYSMMIWFKGFPSHAFRFAGHIQENGLTLQQLFYELTEHHYRDKREIEAPSDRIIPLKTLADFTTLEMLEEIEKRYKKAVPDWGRTLTDKGSYAEPWKKTA